MPATTTPKSILAEVRDLMDGLTYAQQESLLSELLEVLFRDPKDYDDVNDFRVDALEDLVNLRDSYAELAEEQSAQWDLEAEFKQRLARSISPAAIEAGLRRAA